VRNFKMKIAVAMSGGVDSAVTAALLKEEGHEIIGITARFLPYNDINDQIYKANVNDAKAIAEKLGFKHIEVDLVDDFYQNVISPFCSEYLRGKTPNPCIICNRYMKFGKLLDIAKNMNCHLIATGHYAIKKNNNERFYISASPDVKRDQSYFLYMISQEQLRYTIFPIGSYSKNEIREIAIQKNIPVKNKPDSQEICFIPDNDYISFIEKNTSNLPPQGQIVDISGKIIGHHNGIYRYTIGQRRGMGISSPVPLYVKEIDPEKNRIIASTKEELNVFGLETANAFDMKMIISGKIKAKIKCRSTQSPFYGTIERHNNRFLVQFDEPQSGISPGQSAVFYDEGNDVLGGGVIEKTF